MIARPLLALVVMGSLVGAAPAASAADQPTPPPADAPVKCDATTHRDASGAPCKGTGSTQAGTGGNSSTWLLGVLGVAALVGLVAGASSGSKSPASP